MRKRGFEIVSKYEGKGINLPKRATKHAAGYDFECAEDTVIPSVWSMMKGGKSQEARLVPTGIKAYMPEDEYLQLSNRSSNPLKNFLLLANGVGIVDADYHDNEENEGHIYFQFLNFGLRNRTIRKGDRIGQGIFLPFLKVDADMEGEERKGGHGSTGI